MAVQKSKVANAAPEAAKRELVVSRVIGAPIEKVFAAFADGKGISNWWGPHGFSTTTHRMAFEPGGKWVFTMHGPDGTNYENMIHYREILPPARIAYDHYSGETGPLHFKATVSLAKEGAGTRVTLTMQPPSLDEYLAMARFGAIEGGEQTLTRLEAVLAGTAEELIQPFVISREFDAPQELLFKVFTDPEHMKHWWGPKGFKVKKQSIDLKSGGFYLYCLEGPDGVPMWGKFNYREIVPPEKIVWVNSFSDEGGGITRHPKSPNWPIQMLTTLRLDPLEDGRTRLTIIWVPIAPTDIERETFDKGRGSMTMGWTGTLDSLEAYIAKLS